MNLNIQFNFVIIALDFNMIILVIYPISRACFFNESPDDFFMRLKRTAEAESFTSQYFDACVEEHTFAFNVLNL